MVFICPRCGKVEEEDKITFIRYGWAADLPKGHLICMDCAHELEEWFRTKPSELTE
jgi:hypothetical protein